MTTPPNPGSPEAVTAGCTCSVEFNNHGAGAVSLAGAFSLLDLDAPLFWYNDACPLHGMAASGIDVDDED